MPVSELQTPTFYRAVTEVAGQSLKLEWAHDRAFRFFPVERDELCGFRPAAHTAYRPADLARLHLRVPLALPAMKRRWIDALDRARRLVSRLPDQEIGCLYLDQAGAPTSPDPSSDRFRTLERHPGSVGGAWPTVS